MLEQLSKLQELTTLLFQKDFEDEESSVFDLIINFCPVGIILTNEKGDCIFANKEVERITGHPIDDFMNDRWKELIYQDDLKATEDKWLECVKSNTDFFHQYRYKNGKHKWVQAYGRKFDSKKKSGWIVVISEIPAKPTI